MGDVIRKIHRTINYPAAERNKTYILETLLTYITPSKPAKMLEVASGTGQHAKHFAQHLPGVTVQPSEVDESLFDSIKGYAQQVSVSLFLIEMIILTCLELFWRVTQ